MKEEENVCKISMPLISDDEMKQIDNNLDDIVNQATKQFIHDKELAMLQYIIQKQQEEIEEARNTKSLHYENKEWIVNPFLDNFYKDPFLYSIGVK